LYLREKGWLEVGEGCLTRSFIIYVSVKYSDNQIRWMRWTEHEEEEKCMQRLGRKTRKNEPLRRLRLVFEDNIKMNLKIEIGYEGTDWIISE
jgi:hypothetical protein